MWYALVDGMTLYIVSMEGLTNLYSTMKNVISHKNPSLTTAVLAQVKNNVHVLALCEFH